MTFGLVFLRYAIGQQTDKQTAYNCFVTKVTRSSATAEGPRDALCRMKSCQLLHSCTKITFERLVVGNDLEGDSRSLELPLEHISLPITGL